MLCFCLSNYVSMVVIKKKIRIINFEFTYDRVEYVFLLNILSAVNNKIQIINEYVKNKYVGIVIYHRIVYIYILYKRYTYFYI